MIKWQTKKIFEITQLFADGDWIEKKDQSDDGIRLIQTGNVGLGYFKDRAEKARYVSEKTFKRLNCTEILPDDILISRLPDPVGRACIIPNTGEKMITAVDCTIIRFNEDILSKWFIYYSLSSEYQKQIDKEVGGATRQRISRKNLGDINVPVPPLPEQKRIVKALDETFKKLEKAKEIAEKNLHNSKKLFESYIQELFKDDKKDWKSNTLKDVTLKIGSGATPRGGKESYTTEGTALVRSMNVHDRFFKEKNLAYINEKQAKDLQNVTLIENDVLLNITGASVARSCIFPKEMLPARVNQHVSIIRVNRDIIDPVFLNFLLTSNFYKKQLLTTGEQGSTRQAITKYQLEGFLIKYPNLTEQKTIIKKLKQLSEQTKKLESIYQEKFSLIEEFKKSILQKAFSGEL